APIIRRRAGVDSISARSGRRRARGGCRCCRIHGRGLGRLGRGRGAGGLGPGLLEGRTQGVNCCEGIEQRRGPRRSADILKGKGSGVVTMRPDSSIDTVVRRMRLERIGAVVISPDGRSVVGILSERDILRALAEHGTALLGFKAEDLMTREVVTCS